MALPTDRVQLSKRETTALGGDDTDAFPYEVPIEPQQDAIESAGLYFQDASNRDETTLIWREGNDLKFKDGNNSGGLPLSYVTKAKVTSNDTTPNYLFSKITGDGITVTEVNNGGDETLKLIVNSSAAYKFDINPSLLMTSGSSSKVLANDYAAIEIQKNSTAFGVWSGAWKRTPTGNVVFKVRFILKASGTGSYVRIALKVKARAVGEDSSTAFDYSSFLAKAVTTTTIGEIFEETFSVSASVFAAGDSVTLHIGRDGSNSMGGGTNDDYSKAIQIIAVDVDIP